MNVDSSVSTSERVDGAGALGVVVDARDGDGAVLAPQRGRGVIDNNDANVAHDLPIRATQTDCMTKKVKLTRSWRSIPDRVLVDSTPVASLPSTTLPRGVRRGACRGRRGRRHPRRGIHRHPLLRRRHRPHRREAARRHPPLLPILRAFRWGPICLLVVYQCASVPVHTRRILLSQILLGLTTFRAWEMLLATL